MVRGHRAREILAALRGAEPRPGLALGFPIAVLEAQAEAEEAARPSPPQLVPREARARIAAGRPLLQDPPAAGEDDSPARRRLTERLHAALLAHRPDVARTLGAGPELREGPACAFVLLHADRAFLRQAVADLASLVEDEQWLRGRCPICGDEPDLAALEADDAGRRLLCSRCDAEWTYPRIGCPFCDNEDPRQLRYHSVGDGSYRLYVCDRCRRYLKAVDLRRRGRACLPAERVLTAGLDLAALEAGYQARTV